MNASLLQVVAWFVGLLGAVLGLYIILSNVYRVANRRVGTLLLLFAISSFAMGLLFVASDAATATVPTFILSLTAPLLGSGMLAVTVLFVFPRHFAAPLKDWGWVVFVGLLFPLCLGLVDRIFSLNLWYEVLDATTYAGGFVVLSKYATGAWSEFITLLYINAPPLLSILLLLWGLRPQNSVTTLQRQLFWWLACGQIVAVVVRFVLFLAGFPGIAVLATQLVYVLTFAYVGFRDMISEPAVSRISLRSRLILLLTVTTVPILVVGVLLVGVQALTVIEFKEVQRLQALNEALAANVQLWLDVNEDALRELSALPAITSMDPAKQAPLLRAMDQVYPHIFLVSTTDLSGNNVARSDGLASEDYSNRFWFNQARSGGGMVFEVVAADRTRQEPTLVGAMPIQNDVGDVVGVVMFASPLAEISTQVRTRRIGDSGYAYIVNANDDILAHPHSGASENAGERSPIKTLRAGQGPLDKFSDGIGDRWWAYVSEIGPGWGVIVQQKENELLAGTRQFLLVSGIVTVFSVGMLLSLGLFTLQWAFRPIMTLTETANAIAQGDLTRTLVVEGEDEIGMLAQAFNTMTGRLSELVRTLESRVGARTKELERRAEYLAITAQVSLVANAILDVDQLLERIVTLLSERFDFYHTGIFMVADDREWAVLRTVSSDGGRAMLARGHRLRVGQQGIVGYVSGTGRPRIALDVDVDTVWVKNPDLPDTRSEMALPLMTGNQVMGVLDIQSTAPNAFSTEDIETLRILADQVAVAIQNARLFQRSQQSIRELQRAYGVVGLQGWAVRTSRWVGYTYTPEAMAPWVRGEPLPALAVKFALPVEDTQITEVTNTLAVPLRLIGGDRFATLHLRRDKEYPWTTLEKQFVQQAVQSMAQSLEVARLLESTRDRAARDRLIGDIGGRLRATLEPDAIMRATVQSLGRALGAQLTTIEMVNVPGNGARS